MLDSRKQELLILIVNDYIETAEPVGSSYLVATYHLDISSATVRNDMAALEQEGYITQPHTSAGRVPTEKGFQYYVDRLHRSETSEKNEQQLRKAVQNVSEKELAIKAIAKELVELSGEAVIVAFNPYWSYYAGLSNLFRQPEFQDVLLLQTVSVLVDSFDDVIAQVFQDIPEIPKIFLGTENPFGSSMTTIATRFDAHNDHPGFVALIGPIRMNYAKNVPLVASVKKIIFEMNV